MFLNLVVDQAHEELGGGQRKPLGMIVSTTRSRLAVVRGVNCQGSGPWAP